MSVVNMDNDLPVVTFIETWITAKEIISATFILHNVKWQDGGF